MSCSVKFWDLDFALKCVHGSEATADKLRKAELVRAIGALTWFIRGLPQGVPLLEEVRSLAGRVQDGLDTPGTDYVDHPLRALKAQPELTPYTYSAAMVRAEAPRAGPPQRGHVAAYSFVPDEVLSGAGGAGTARAARTAAAAAGEMAAAVAAMAGASQGQLAAQGGDRAAVLAAAAVAATEEAAAAAAALAAASQDSLLFTQEDGEQPSGEGGDDHAQGKVSAPAVNDDLAQDSFVDDSDLTPRDGVGDEAGNVRAPAAIDPLVAVGSTVGRGRAGQSQVQVGSQVQVQADNNKKKLCKSVWRDHVCRDKDCDRAHPPRCGDPRCFPWRRRSCQYWHRVADSKEQGNCSSADPGRAERGQVQGSQQQRQQSLQRRRGRPQGASDQRQQQQRRQLRQHQPHMGGGRQQQQRQPARHWQQRLPQHRQQQQQQQQERPSYRDIALRGLPSLSSSSNFNNGGNFVGGVARGPTSGGFGLGQPDPATLSTVVAAVMAVLAGGTQPF